MIETRAYHVGIIASRHEMPVDEYLVESVTPGQSAYDQIYDAIASWLERHPGAGRRAEMPLYLYYSGLTEATLAVSDAIHNFGCRWAHLMRFDRVRQEYEPLQRRMAACAFQNGTGEELRDRIGGR